MLLARFLSSASAASISRKRFEAGDKQDVDHFDRIIWPVDH
jgi:hypothetical protein